MSPFLRVPKWYMYTLVYPVVALAASTVILLVVLLPLPLEAMFIILALGIGHGGKAAFGIAAVIYGTLHDWYKFTKEKGVIWTQVRMISINLLSS